MKLAWIEPGQALPPASHALRQPDGLLAAGRDLTAARLREAYGKGIFPWFSPGDPVLWWSPDPRMVLFIDEFKVSRSFAKTLRRLRAEKCWTLRTNTAFGRVMRECAAPRPGADGTWITPEIIAAYCELHAQGAAHSVEVWRDDELIGGLYGVSLGRMFFGESMFARETDASKVALAALVHLLCEAGYRVIDCQQDTRHLASLGARPIDRESFLAIVSQYTAEAAPDWRSLSIEIPDA